MLEKCKKIVDHYGVEHQLDILVEEMGELLQAIGKLKRYNARDNFIEELSDVSIMLVQMFESLSETEKEKFIKTMIFKVNRQLHRF